MYLIQEGYILSKTAYLQYDLYQCYTNIVQFTY